MDAVHDVVGVLGRRRGRHVLQSDDTAAASAASNTAASADRPPVGWIVLGAGGVRVVGRRVRMRVHRLGDDLVRGALWFGMSAPEGSESWKQQRHQRRHQRLARKHGDRLHAERQQHGPSHPSGQQDGLRVLLLLAPACEQCTPPGVLLLLLLLLHELLCDCDFEQYYFLFRDLTRITRIQ